MDWYKPLFIILFFLSIGCTVEPGLPGQQDKYMISLEKDVEEVCDDLVSGIAPGSICITWYDNLHPNSPMLSEAYVASMFKRRLSSLGFSVIASEKGADYELTIVMTPGERSLLVLAGIYHQDRVITTRQAYFTRGPGKWSKALSSYRYRTNTRIPLGSAP